MKTHRLFDSTSRHNKANKILNVIRAHTNDEVQKFRCLDIGCSNGLISNLLADEFLSLVGIDVEQKLVVSAKEDARYSPDRHFLVADGAYIPFPDNWFDLIICAQVYEHTPLQDQLVDEIWRVLKTNGICFFSGPNKFGVIEEHYWLPFLSWLPKYFANKYLRLFNRGNEYDIYPLSYRSLTSLLKKFMIHDYSISMLKNPARFDVKVNRVVSWTVNLLPATLARLLLYIVPNYNWILTKKSDRVQP